MENPLWWVVGAALLVLVVLFLRGHFTAEAREARRRRRSHGRVVSKIKGPSVKLAVKTDRKNDNN